ncbi:MAG: DUF5615 family PIN-like protein [Acidobacteria bacterium]|nr:DUF5615 family PIN-like protein [Acidobacteriota bacterium]
MFQILFDGNFNLRIIRGLKLRLSNCQYETVQNFGLSGKSDPEILEFAAANNFILATHDVNTIPKFAYQRVASGLKMSGVIAVPELFPIGLAINELEVLIQCSRQNEWENQVLHIPL